MNNPLHVAEAAAPVRDVRDGSGTDRLEDGTALCLSGGGYRAMLFHVGAILRLNELAILKSVKRISSVSGGSITAAVLGMNWKHLRFEGDVAQNLKEMLVEPIRKMASRTIDVGSVLGGVFSPFSTVGDKIASAYDDVLFHGATLQSLPDDSAVGAADSGPRFVINATSVQTGALWRFSRPYMGDYRVGLIRRPNLPLAQAVAASSAFPPVLSPVTLDVDPGDFDSATYGDLWKDPYNNTVVLSDGGVYDNMGLETAWKRYKTVLVSDGGAPFTPEAEPETDWGRHVYRVLNLIDNQVRSLRRRQIIAAFQNPNEPHNGAFWEIGADIRKYAAPGSYPQAPDDDFIRDSMNLSQTATRLARLSEVVQNRLMNWGYLICDASVRKHAPRLLPSQLSSTTGMPFSGGVG